MTPRVLALSSLLIIAGAGCRRPNDNHCADDPGGAQAGSCVVAPDLGATVACQTDDECPAGQICSAGVCAAGCHSGRDCPVATPICDPSLGGGTCVACAKDGDCAAGQQCANHGCVTPCASDSDCAPPTPRCDPTTNHCVACLSVNDCQLGSVCKANVCAPGCGNDRDCPAATPRCDTAHAPDGLCVVCLGPSDCKAGQTCKAGLCIDICSGDSECPSGHCDPTSMTCVECTANAHCPLGKVCVADACVPGCIADRDCPAATPRCDPSRGPSGTCVACVGNADCPGGSCQMGGCVYPVPPGMISIAAGEFTMGDDDTGIPFPTTNNGPQHPVVLSQYTIDKNEVTNDAYRQCVAAGACQLPSDATQYNDHTKGNYPVVFVDYAKATAYCAWAGKRLPTEAEWEKAARGTDKRAYPWGATTPACGLTNAAVATNAAQCLSGVTQVGSYPSGASPYGVLDMAGNAREWVYDWEGDYPSTTVTDPAGPKSGTNRMTRGGSYLSTSENISTFARLSHLPTDTVDAIGFRCATGPTPRPAAPPTASFTVSPSSGTTSTTFAVDASGSSDPLDPPAALRVRWSFGDGSGFGGFSTSKTATKKYGAGGTYTITVELQNSAGYSAQATRSVTVTGGGTPDMGGGGGDEGAACDTSHPCSSNYDCYQGFCRFPCFFATGCPPGFHCDAPSGFGYCLPN